MVVKHLVLFDVRCLCRVLVLIHEMQHYFKVWRVYFALKNLDLKQSFKFSAALDYSLWWSNCLRLLLLVWDFLREEP